MTDIRENYIDGAFVPSTATESLPLIDPVDESLVGSIPVSTAADVDAAVAAAQRAFRSWGRTPPRNARRRC